MSYIMVNLHCLNIMMNTSISLGDSLGDRLVASSHSDGAWRQ